MAEAFLPVQVTPTKSSSWTVLSPLQMLMWLQALRTVRLRNLLFATATLMTTLHLVPATA